jgi:hypothetical protein
MHQRDDDKIVASYKQKADYNSRKDDFDLRISRLPAVFQDRINSFRKHSCEWGPRFEAHELYVCEQAIAIADALKTGDQVKSFYSLGFDEQRKLVPGIDDGHSVNSFGTACQLAKAYLESAEIVTKMHGALCSLVGCNDYGCYAIRVGP